MAWDTEAVTEIQRYAILAQQGGYDALEGMTLSTVDGQGGPRTGNSMVAMTGQSVSQLNSMTEAQYANQLDAKMQNDPAFRDAVITGLENNPEMAQEFLQQQNVADLDAYKEQLGIAEPETAAPEPVPAEPAPEPEVQADPDLRYKQGLLAVTEQPGVSHNDVTGLPNEDTAAYNDVAVEDLERFTAENSTRQTLNDLNDLAMNEGGGYVGMLQSLLKSLGFDIEVTGEMDAQTTNALPDAETLLTNRDTIIDTVMSAEQDNIGLAPNGAGLTIIVDGHEMPFERDAIMEHGSSLTNLLMNSPEALIALEAAQGADSTNSLLEAAGIDPSDSAFRAAIESAPESDGRDAMLERLDGGEGAGADADVTTADPDNDGLSTADILAGTAGAGVLAAGAYALQRNREREAALADADPERYAALQEYDADTQRMLDEREQEVRAQKDAEADGAASDAERDRAQAALDEDADTYNNSRGREAGRENALRAARMHMAKAHLHAAGLPEGERADYLNNARDELDEIVDAEMGKRGMFMTDANREAFTEGLREEAFRQANEFNGEINGARDVARANALDGVDAEVEQARRELAEDRAANRPGAADVAAADADADPDAPAADADADPNPAAAEADTTTADADTPDADPDATLADSDADARAADADTPDVDPAATAAEVDADPDVNPDAAAAEADADPNANPNATEADAPDTDVDADARGGDHDGGRTRWGRAAMIGGGAIAILGLSALAVSAEELPDDVRDLAENGDYEAAAELFVEQGGGAYASELQNLMETQPDMVNDLMSAVMARAMGDQTSMAVFLGNLGLGEEVVQDFVDGNYGNVVAEVSGFAEAQRNYEAAETTGDKADVVIGETAETLFMFTPAGVAIEGVSLARAGIVTFAESQGIELPSLEDAHRETLWDYLTTSDEEVIFETFAEEAHAFLNEVDLNAEAPAIVVDTLDLHAQWVLAEQTLQQAKDELPAWYANDRITGQMEINNAREHAVAAQQAYESHLAALDETGELMYVRSYMDAMVNHPAPDAPEQDAPGPSPTEIGPAFMAQAGQPEAAETASVEPPEETAAYSIAAYSPEQIEQGYMPLEIEAGALSIGDAMMLHDMDVVERPELVSAMIEDAVMALPEAEREAFLEAAIGYYEEQPLIGMTDTPYGAVLTLQRDALVDVQEKLNAPDDEVNPDLVSQADPVTPGAAAGYKAGLTS